MLPPDVGWGLGMQESGGECGQNADFCLVVFKDSVILKNLKITDKLQLGNVSQSSFISFWGSSDYICRYSWSKESYSYC